MIASLSGVLSWRVGDQVVVDVGGVGYRVFVSQLSSARLPPVGEKVFLFIHTAVREDDINLFGFVTDGEKRLFQKLISINGIGPKLALTILSGILPDDLVAAVRREDLVRLTAIPGIGKKTAERIILDLKDKLHEFFIGGNGKRELHEEATSALVNLGYTRSNAEKTLARLTIQEGTRLEVIIREALRVLSHER